MQHFVGFVFPGSAEADNACGKKWAVIWSPVVLEMLVSKIIKIL